MLPPDPMAEKRLRIAGRRGQVRHSLAIANMPQRNSAFELPRRAEPTLHARSSPRNSSEYLGINQPSLVSVHYPTAIHNYIREESMYYQLLTFSFVHK